MVAAGVNLLSIYGTTEVRRPSQVSANRTNFLQTGSLLNSEREMATDKNWNWVRAKGMILDYLVMEPRGDNTFEAVVKDGYPPKVTFF